tara:strand:- start:2581 stop:4701 length:2121 start_codon:yes stop_codon:yes gene_type:complete
MITMPMAGCLGGDDSSDAPDEELADWNVHFAATAADLPTCDEDTNGRLYYVEADNQFQVCKTSGWTVIDIQGADGSDGMNGADGADGVDGADGAAGADGAEGPQGSAGIDGSPTLIRVLSSISCETGGNTFEIGSDNNNDGVLDISEIGLTVDLCNGGQGPQGVAGNDGVDGQNGTDGEMGLTGPNGLAGSDGTNSLISSMNEPSGVNCAAGGMNISVGFDYDNDTYLSMNEIVNNMYVCDGSDGVTTTLPWNNLTNIPNDLLDGDNDTTYSGNDFAISGQTCSGSSMVIAAIDVTGSIICVYDQDTLYDGNDFATSNQSCPTGEFLSGITLTGKLVCSVPVDTTLSEAQVDAFVANNNYANATDLSNIQTVLDNVTTCVIGAYANCSGMYLFNVDLSNMDLTGIDFSHSELINVDFSNSGLKFADFTGADIDDVNFSYTDIKHAVFSGATISNTDFSNSTMKYASIDGADFYRPVFTGADLTKVDFSKIDEMTDTYTIGYSSCSVYTTRNSQDAVYSGYLYGSVIRYYWAVPISFEGAILDGANFEGMELWPLDLTNASGVYVNFDDTSIFDDFTGSQYCSVSGSLPKVSGNSSAPSYYYTYSGNYQTSLYRHEHSTFTDFDGESSSFEMSSILDDANLQRADLRNSNLMYVDFSMANLTDAELDYSWLHFTNFDDAIVTGVDFYNSNWYQTVWTNGLAYNSNQA